MPWSKLGRMPLCLVILCAASPIRAGVPAIGFPRMPAVSPDGRSVAFSYQGDLWVAPASGGEARRLTANPAYDAYPCWSPDGAWIAFASDRDGNDDLYVLPVEGGMVRQLSFHGDADRPVDWTPDSRAILFESVRYLKDGGRPGLWMVPLDGGSPAPLMSTAVGQAKLSPDGKRLVYTRGTQSWWRRGYVGSAHTRLWIFDADGPALSSATWRTDTRAKSNEDAVTNAALYATENCWSSGSHRALPEVDEELGNRQNPLWLPDGNRIIYLNDARGIANLKLLDLTTGERRAISSYQGERLRFPSLARDGSVLAVEVEDRIDIFRLPAQPSAAVPPEPLRIELPIDPKAPEVERVKVTKDATEMALSPDGKQIAFVAQGEIFVMRANEDASFANRVTQDPARDWQIGWSGDSKSLVFVSDRDGNAEIYRVRSADPEESRLARSLRFETTRLTDDPAEDFAPSESPDGKTIAFVRGLGALMAMKPDGSGVHALLDGAREITFRWSPDSKWIAYSAEDEEYNFDVWILAADGMGAPHNVSMHPDNDTGPVWSPDGKLLLWTSPRRFFNQVDLWYVRLSRADEELSRFDREDQLNPDEGGPDEDTHADSFADPRDSSAGDAKKSGSKHSASEKKDADSAKVEVKIDFDRIYRRAHRLTGFAGTESDPLVTKDGKEVVFVADADGKRDIWKIEWDGSEPKRITNGGVNPSRLQWDAKKANIFYLKQGGVIASTPLSGGESKTFAYDASIRIDRATQRRFTFAEAWRALRDNFYDPKYHGADWNGLFPKYSRWASEASTYRDFQDVVRLMLGELNASHVETWDGPTDTPSAEVPAAIGELGLVFESGTKELIVAHVIPRSPADREESRVRVGETLTSIEGQPVSRAIDIASLLDQTVDRRIRIGLRDRDGKARDVVIRPTTRDAIRALLYDEQIDLRRATVERESEGRVGYLHIAGMGAGNFDDYERDLYAVAHGKDALIIDVRENGGGWITDLLLASLMTPEHAITSAPGRIPGYPQDRRIVYAWTRPIVVLCDENSFSNAEIFAQAIKTLKRGPVVGQTTYGGVISTGGMTLADGSWLRLPSRGWTTLEDKTELENRGCRPDIAVENTPDDLARGIDRQLERGLEEAERLIR